MKEGNQLNALKVLLEEVERAKDLDLHNLSWTEQNLRCFPILKDLITTKTKQKSEILIDEYVRNF